MSKATEVIQRYIRDVQIGHLMNDGEQLTKEEATLVQKLLLCIAADIDLAELEKASGKPCLSNLRGS
jgi:hypothetical protein